jgi:hypothetical protein
MAEIRNVTRNGETFYPLTCTDAVVDRDGNPLEIVNDIFDISEYNASGTPPVLAKYSTLALALAAVPQSKQKGGMTIRYVPTSDNKYVQYRLMADSWSVDTNDWAFCGDSVYVENPEWRYVLLDAKKRILGAYPYKVIQTPSGEYLAVDRAGVGLVIAQPNDRFNQIYFDIVDGVEVEQDG